MDMIERKKFQDYQNIETLVNEGLHIAMSHVLADDSLDVILSYLGKILKADRVYIFEKNARGNDDNTYEWAYLKKRKIFRMCPQRFVPTGIRIFLKVRLQ